MRTFRLIVLAGAGLAALTSSAFAQGRVKYNIYTRLDGPLVSARPYPANRADSVRRPGYNGRLWVGRPVVGGREDVYPRDWSDPGPNSYGAFENDDSIVYARLGTTVVGFSPWEEVDGNRQLEAARQKWLEMHNFTGGVRTFVNDAYVERFELASADEPAADAQPGARGIQPRATITLPIDQPRFRKRMQVEASPKAVGGAQLLKPQHDGEVARISAPSHLPHTIVITGKDNAPKAEADKAVAKAEDAPKQEAKKETVASAAETK